MAAETRTYIPIIGSQRGVTQPNGDSSARGLQIQQGSFSKVSRVNRDGAWVADRWYYCREWFHEQSCGVKRILYAHKKGKSENLARFIRKLDRHLKVDVKTEIGPTQRKTISWIKVSPWWSKTSMKRSFFTMMLRCGQNYDPQKDNFREAVMSINYTRDTEYAVKRFLAGHTRYTGRTKGWYQAFRWGFNGFRPNRSQVTRDAIQELLVRPE